MKTRTIKKIIFTTVLVFTGLFSYAQMMEPGDPGGGPTGLIAPACTLHKAALRVDMLGEILVKRYGPPPRALAEVIAEAVNESDVPEWRPATLALQRFLSRLASRIAGNCSLLQQGGGPDGWRSAAERFASALEGNPYVFMAYYSPVLYNAAYGEFAGMSSGRGDIKFGPTGILSYYIETRQDNGTYTPNPSLRAGYERCGPGLGLEEYAFLHFYSWLEESGAARVVESLEGQG